MKTNDIEVQFDSIAKDYDSQRRKFIPCYDDYYITSTNFIASSIPKPQKVLDLGAGTGLLTKYVYDHFPDSEYTLVDISKQMLEIATKRFEGLSNFKYEVVDYSKSLPNEDFDLVVSALSIHHLSERDKKQLYSNVYKVLPPNGTFLNLDQFNASSDTMNEMYNSWWYRSIINSDLPKSEYDRWLKRRELDKENTIVETMNMLKDVGFNVVECIYSYMKFGVIVAIK